MRITKKGRDITEYSFSTSMLQCPQATCRKHFSVKDAIELPNSKKIKCPYCEYSKDSSAFVSNSFKKNAEKRVMKEINNKIEIEIKKIFR